MLKWASEGLQLGNSEKWCKGTSLKSDRKWSHQVWIGVVLVGSELGQLAASWQCVHFVHLCNAPFSFLRSVPIGAISCECLFQRRNCT